ncbi:semaphorin-4B isoform X2 [Vombatus ursinus]|uniref:semaphorin-4B isoform X2 n=1 Tax=Vombatus ursinus TaxID=29139 RepID=UPI000FFD7397|nr:semaphorin-4B isoform X2 [Vombatus ursinus]
MGFGSRLAQLGALFLLLRPKPLSEAIVPRVSLPYGSEERTVWRCEAEGITNYTALLLSKDGKTLFVGAREALFALSSSSSFLPGGHYQKLLWSADPEKKRQCVFKGKDSQNIQNFSLERDGAGNVLLEDGKGRCPFDPEYKSTAIMVDGKLYAGTVSNFQGNEPTISQSQGNRLTLKTENSLNWLQDPAFVSSAYIPESLDNPRGDDDKIYFFFSETGKEFDFFENTIVSRIARVCKGDLGGERVLQRRWTSFLKAQLLCSRPSDGFPFNVLQDVFVLSPSPKDWQDSLFYGVFTSQWHQGAAGGSAICVFTMRDVESTFNGLYKEVNRETQQWYTVMDSPTPRPGACITNSAREKRINSSLQLPDRVLNFLKDHFLMDRQVRSNPLLLQTRARYQRLSVHRVHGLHHTYDVLFLGTSDGRLHKTVSARQRVHIIEEIRLFPPDHPVQNLLLDPHRGLLYASSYSAVVQVSVANCSLYPSCGECILSRDPYCAWSGTSCRDVRHYQPELASQPWVQDIEDANTEQFCNNSAFSRRRSSTLSDEIPCKQVHFLPNTVNTLTCRLLSNLASRRWLHNKAPINNSASYRVLPSGDLLLVGSQDGLGSFQCWSLEENYQQLVASYCVEAIESAADGEKGSIVPFIINTSRVSSSANGKAALVPYKTYWTEFLLMCGLFGFAVVLLALFFLYRHRDGMKVFLKQGECASVHPRTRPVMLPSENRSLNGGGPPSALPDHKGYQALADSSPGLRAFTESEKRPLSIQDSFVEVSPPCPRPRVRLGSEIRDSVV